MWEYLVIKMDTRGEYAMLEVDGAWHQVTVQGRVAHVNDLGADGWELVSVGAWAPDAVSELREEVALAVFKRRIGA